MRIEALRKLAGREEVDYQFLMSALSDYASPRDKITTWLNSGELIRVKKGLYVFGQSVALEPYSLEVLANLIYGPSAISLTYALSYYGLIPEKVAVVTSITDQRIKKFHTPVGDFHYVYLNTRKYEVGIELQHIGSAHQFLMATPEKALCDQIHLIDKQLTFETELAISNYLFHDLRVDSELFYQLDENRMGVLAEVYQNPSVNKLYEFLKAGE